MATTKYQIVKAGSHGNGKKHIFVYGASDGHVDIAFCGKDITRDAHYAKPVAIDWLPDRWACPACLGCYIVATGCRVIRENAQ